MIKKNSQTQVSKAMKKSIFVVDEGYQTMGTTYEARAKQLIKKGRAKWIDRQTIAIVGDSVAVSASNSNDIAVEWDDKDEAALSFEDSFMEDSSFRRGFEWFVHFFESGKNVLLSFVCSFVVCFIWLGICSGILDSFIDSGTAAFLFFVPTFAICILFLFEVGIYVRSKINKGMEKDDIVFMAVKAEDDKTYNEKLAMYVKDRLNRKRKLTLHISFYVVVNFFLLVSFSSSVWYMDASFVVVSICFWGIAVAMHFIIYKTHITPMQIRREMEKLKSGRTDM